MNSSNSDTLTDFLNDPSSYPHNPERVEHIQTHASNVFIASPFVYKIKKEVNFGFLDFSSLEKRHHYCQQEVMLNRRFCNDTYLDVTPLFKSSRGWSFSAHEGNDPAEYAVRMKELSPDGLLKTRLNEQRLTTDHLDLVIDHLVRYYEQQTGDSDKAISEAGLPSAIRFNIEENYRQTEKFVGKIIDRGTYNAIQKFTDSFLKEHEPLLKKRVRENRIVDGHGDLHLEHIHIRENSVCFFDCIEFNERFRYLDVASEIAFLSMDLDFNNHPGFGRYVIDRLAEKLKDPELILLTDLYKCYRAYVRGKVKSLESNGQTVSAESRTMAAKIAKNYFNLSLRYALFGSEPTLIVVMGPVASGKSTLATELAKTFGFQHYSSDIIRKQTAGIPLDQRTPEAVRPDLYSSKMTQQTYSQLISLAEKELLNGRSVILDATFGNPENRRDLMDRVGNRDWTILFAESQVSDSVREERLRKRADKAGVISDARIEDLSMLDHHYQSPDELDPKIRIPVNTDSSPKKSLSELFSEIIRSRFL